MAADTSDDIPHAEGVTATSDFDLIHSSMLGLFGEDAAARSGTGLFLRGEAAAAPGEASPHAAEAAVARDAAGTADSQALSVGRLLDERHSDSLGGMASEGGGSEPSTPRSAINEEISDHSSDGEARSWRTGRPTKPPGRPGLFQSPRVRRLQEMHTDGPGAWPRYERRVRWTRPTVAPSSGNIRAPIDLDAAYTIMRPRAQQDGPMLQRMQEVKAMQHLPLEQKLQRSKKTTPVGLLPEMKIPGRYGLAMKPVRDVGQLRLRSGQ